MNTQGLPISFTQRVRTFRYSIVNLVVLFAALLVVHYFPL